MSDKESASQNKSILWLDEEQRLGLNVPSDSGPAHAVSAEIARELAAGNVAAVAKKPCAFFVYMVQTGYLGKGTFSDCLIDNTLAVVNRLSAEMHSALQEHDGRKRGLRDALTLAKNWIASYGPLCRWASSAWVWRCQEAGLFDNPPPCDWDASGEIRRHNVSVGVFAPLIDTHENASALLVSVAAPSDRAVISMACAWLRSEDQSLDSAQPPCDAGKDVHAGLPILRRIVFDIPESKPEGLLGVPSFDRCKITRKSISQKDAAIICGCSPREIRNWERGVHTPDGWPGRYDAVALRAWVETKKSQMATKIALKNSSRDAARRATSVDPKDRSRRFGSNNQRDIDAQDDY